MLMINNLVGFGCGLPLAYRYMRLTIPGYSAGDTWVGEWHALVGAVEYPAPSMTGNTSPAPLVAAATYENADAYRPFSRSASFWTPEANQTASLTLDFGVFGALPRPTAFTMTIALGAPPATVMEVSRDGVNWETLVNASGLIWTANVPKVFAVG